MRERERGGGERELGVKVEEGGCQITYTFTSIGGGRGRNMNGWIEQRGREYKLSINWLTILFAV